MATKVHKVEGYDLFLYGYDSPYALHSAPLEQYTLFRPSRANTTVVKL